VMAPLKFSGRPELRHPALIIGWDTDAGELGPGVTTYLRDKLKGQAFCEIDPVEFFPLNGVVIENNIVMFPDSIFYACPAQDLIVFEGTIPRYEWFRFLNLIMDVARQYNVRELYTVGGMVSLGAHTAPRDFWATFSSPRIKRSLVSYELSRELDFETPPGGRPTLNSFVLWTARQHSLEGANLWVPVPFYLVAASDPRAQKRVLEFLDHRLGLELDLGTLDREIRRQSEQLARLRGEMPDIDRAINKLESNLRLSETEHEKLVKAVEEYLKPK